MEIPPIKTRFIKDIPRLTGLERPTLEKKYTVAASLVPIPATVIGKKAINIIIGTKIKK